MPPPSVPAARRILLLDGSRLHDDAGTARRALTAALAEGAWQVDTIALADAHIVPCMGCFSCWVKTPGVCVKDDEGRRLAEAHMRSDLVVWFTPVTFGGYSSQLKKAVDALLPNTSPFFRIVGGEVHHQERYTRYPSLFCLGVMPRPDAESEAIFRRLVARNAINLHAPRWQASIAYAGARSEITQVELAASLQALVAA